jgi:hypothetical protein
MLPPLFLALALAASDGKVYSGAEIGVVGRQARRGIRHVPIPTHAAAQRYAGVAHDDNLLARPAKRPRA